MESSSATADAERDGGDRTRRYPGWLLGVVPLLLIIAAVALLDSISGSSGESACPFQACGSLLERPLIWACVCQVLSTGCPRLGRASCRSRGRRVRLVRDARSD